MKTYIVATERIDWLAEKIGKINARAKRLHVAPLTFNVSEPRVVTQANFEALGLSPQCIKRIYHEVTVGGESPKMAGWTFLGTIQHEDGGNILRVSPEWTGGDIPANFRNDKPECDHCKTARRRNDTYILRHDDGTWKQVGTNCIRDFLGHDAAYALAMAQVWFSAADIIGDSDDELGGFGFGGSPSAWDTEHFMAVVCCNIRTCGWVSSKMMRDSGSLTSTSARALNDLYWSPRSQSPKPESPSEGDRENAKAIVAWGEALSLRAELNDYLHNLSVIFNGEVVTARMAGFAASAAMAWSRETQREIERKRAAETSAHVGTVGERTVFTLTLSDIRTMEGDYGTTFLYSFLDAAGNSVKWFSSRDAGLKVGSTYSGKATVKKHDDYKGVKQTLITRAALTLVEGAPVE